MCSGCYWPWQASHGRRGLDRMTDRQVAGQRFLIDCDTGIDDALALMLVCAKAGRGSLEAVTCTAGNTGLEAVVANTLLTLEQCGQDLPVYAGCSRPLVGPPLPGETIMGPDGLGGATQHFEPARAKAQAGHASLAILAAARQPGPLTLVALGPLTNLALAVGLHNQLPQSIERLVIMGGAVQAQGNASPAAEFNFFMDPEAAYTVLHAGFRDILLVPWETCVAAALPWPDYRDICRQGTPAACFFGLVTAELAKILEGQFHLPGLVLPDVLAAALALDGNIGLDIRPAAVDVLTQGGPGRGFMPADWRGMQGNPPNARLVMEVDTRKYIALLRSVFGNLE